RSDRARPARCGVRRRRCPTRGSPSGGGQIMKICPACGERHATEGWVCPRCGWSPPPGDFPSFVPGGDPGGYDETLFRELVPLEERSFWFRSRNELIAWALRTHFPTARSFFELGCGTGYVLSGLRERFPRLELAGGEPYLARLERARERLPHVPLFRLA